MPQHLRLETRGEGPSKGRGQPCLSCIPWFILWHTVTWMHHARSCKVRWYAPSKSLQSPVIPTLKHTFPTPHLQHGQAGLERDQLSSLVKLSFLCRFSLLFPPFYCSPSLLPSFLSSLSFIYTPNVSFHSGIFQHIHPSIHYAPSIIFPPFSHYDILILLPGPGCGTGIGGISDFTWGI